MTLEFRPPQVQQRPSASDYSQQWAQGLNNIGDTLAGISDQKKKRDMEALALATKAKDAGMDPMAVYSAAGGNPSRVMLPQTGPTLQPNAPLMPGFGQEASAGMSDVPQQPQPSRSRVVDAWNNHPNLSQFAPQQKPRTIFDTAPVDVGGIMNGMSRGDYSGWDKLDTKRRQQIIEDPRYKAMVKPGDTRDYPQAHLINPDLKQADFETAYPNGIPREDLNLMATRNKNDVAVSQKADQRVQDRLQKLGESLDPSKSTRGAFSVSKQVFDRAERLESLANAYADGNLDSRQIEELAIGLNSMLSGANTGAAHQVESLVPRTVWGNSQKLKEFFLNDPQGMQQQAFVQRMLGSVGREKQTALDQMNRTRFSRISPFSDLEQSNPQGFYDTLRSWDVDPEQYKSWKKGGFKSQSAVQAPEGQGGGNDLQSAAAAELARRRGAKR